MDDIGKKFLQVAGVEGCVKALSLGLAHGLDVLRLFQ